jgi:YidC/Oxa1 family membrane protein insertase
MISQRIARRILSSKSLHRLSFNVDYLPNTNKRHYGSETAVLFSAVQEGLIQIHNVTQLPWWGTIALSTVGMRVAMLPILRYQLLTFRKLAGAMPEIGFAFQLLRNRLQTIPITNVGELAKVFSAFYRGTSAVMKLNEVSMMEIFAYPIINASIFIIFVISTRDLLLTGPAELGFQNGGISWFADLMQKDSSYVLPSLSVLLSYTALDIGFRGPNTGRILSILKDVIQSLLIFSTPGIFGLPAGVFCYWIPNSIFSIMQTTFLRNPNNMKYLGIPPPPNMPTPPPKQS